MTMPVKTNKAPATKTTTSDKQKYSLTLESRQQLRDMIFESEDTREFHPLDYAVIRPLVKDEYLDIFDSAVESGQKCSIEIDLNKGYDAKQPIESNPGFQFIRGWLRANGKNRTPKDGHYGSLASGFRSEFASDATHWVIDSNGMVANGGHSGHGVALAFYPPSVEYGVYGARVLEDSKDETSFVKADSEYGKSLLEEWQADFPGYMFIDSEGYVCESSVLAWKNHDESELRVGEYDEDGNYIAHSDTPNVRTKQDLSIVLRINANPSSCLKMDDVRLEASFDDYLEMVAPIRAFMRTLPKKVKEIAGTLFRGYYLRVNHSKESYGHLGKGGRLTKNEVQQWFVAGAPMLLDSIELLKNSLGTDLKQFPHFLPIKGGKGQVSLANALIAMMVSSPTGRERIAKVLTEQYSKLSDAPNYFQKLVDYIIKKPGDSSTAPSADQIVQCLVFLGEGKTDPVAEMQKQYPTTENAKGEMQYASPWQVELNRVLGWDRTNLDHPVAEQFTDVCISAATRIAEILGNEGDVKNAKMKATRKGAGSRGKNKGK